MDLKRVLITGKNSYVGTNVEKWLMKESKQFYVESISVRGDDWESFDFSEFDVLFHVAGLVHKKERTRNRDLFYEINRDLTIKVANKAKKEGVKQFIFISTMSVYGEHEGLINKTTKVRPTTAYGKSKLEAENYLTSLNDEAFKVSILRPPMIYGKDSIGNYRKLSKIVRLIPVFPKIKNKRSILFIDNFSEFIKKLIISEKSGVYFPQNKEYTNTSDLVYSIAKCYKKKIFFIKFFGSYIKKMRINLIRKIFSDLYYEQNISMHDWDYALIDFEKSIVMSER
jgi:UDP-glucose 4-epimerase